jgi:hypothetical protein
VAVETPPAKPKLPDTLTVQVYRAGKMAQEKFELRDTAKKPPR